MSIVLSAKNLSRSFNGFRAVDAINFEIRQGECFGILGPNGAGKTTTIKMIYGALSLTSGELTVFGQSIEKNKKEIKQKIGVVLQRDILEEPLSAWDNLRIHGKHYGLPQKIIAEKSAQLLDLFQLKEKSDQIIFKYSGGMKRRLSIAKSLMNDPQLLLLDEPTTGLDPQARHLLWDKIRDFKKRGMSILLSTHYMHEAEALCDHLIILDNGKIIERGAPLELIQKHGCKNLEEVFLKRTGKELRD